jgi:hypothetical protein
MRLWRESVIRLARPVSSAAWVLDSSYRCRCPLALLRLLVSGAHP